MRDEGGGMKGAARLKIRRFERRADFLPSDPLSAIMIILSDVMCADSLIARG